MNSATPFESIESTLSSAQRQKLQDYVVLIREGSRKQNLVGPRNPIMIWEDLIMDAASQYMDHIQHTWEIRFDIISIILHENAKYEIKHFEDAFYY